MQCNGGFLSATVYLFHVYKNSLIDQIILKLTWEKKYFHILNMNETVSTEMEVNVSGGFYAGVLGMDPQLNCLDIINN